LAGILAGAGIGFSGRYNALYGKDEFAAILAQMCESGRTAEEAVRILGDGRMAVPSARWFRDMMRSVRPEKARRVCAGLVRRSAAAARRQCLRRGGPVTVAIDKHEIPRYDKKNMANLVYSKRKSGTNKFEAYATMQAVGSEANVTIGCLPVTRDRSDRDFVRDMLRILRRSGIRC